MATSRVAERLDAPRNKISGLTGVPPLRRFFNHPSDVPLREIIQARDILIVDANMGAIGTENSKACMLFILRMLHAQLQRQVHLPEAERPRVPLLVDEAHYVAGGENVVDQIATHRAAGLEPAFGLQYFAQLGSASEHQQKILKGVLNLLQSRFLFRMGDAQDAEQATRIAMAVYATMIRDDPDSRARLRVTPEQALNFPNYYCLASWIATRHPGTELHGPDLPAARRRRRVGRAAPRRAGRARRAVPRAARVDARRSPTASDGRNPPSPATERRWRSLRHARRRRSRRRDRLIRAASQRRRRTRRRSTRSRSTTSHPRRRPPTSPTARSAGSSDARSHGPADRARPTGRRRHAARARVPRPDQRDRPRRPARRRGPPAAPLRRGLRDPRAARPGRARAREPDRPRRAARPGARTVFDRLVKLYRHGLIARHTTGLRRHSRNDGKPPLLHSLTRRGLEVAQQRAARAGDLPQARVASRSSSPAPARLAHDLHALGWAIEFHRAVGDLATDRWRTPRYATGRYPVPQVGQGQRRHPITLNEIPVPDGQAIIDLELKTFTEIKPDLSLELRIEPLKLTFDLLVEIDLTARPSYNRDKFLAYDAFLCGWSLAHPRYRAQGTRPAVVFVSADNHAALACAREADELMTGRIGVMGSPAEHWYYAGRDHLFFAVEDDIHHGDLSARSRFRRTRPGCANGSTAGAIWRSTG